MLADLHVRGIPKRLGSYDRRTSGDSQSRHGYSEKKTVAAETRDCVFLIRDHRVPHEYAIKARHSVKAQRGNEILHVGIDLIEGIRASQ